jgi:hypothetical protein
MHTATPRIFPVICVLLLSAVALAWARSARFTDGMEIVSPRGGMLISSHPGRLCACWPSPFVHPAGSRRWSVSAASTARDDAIPIDDPPDYDVVTQADSAERPKFVAGSDTISGVLTQYVELPYWMLLLLPAMPLAWMLAGGIWSSVKRRRLGLCRECGYDLRASPGVCPECGTSRVNDRPRRHWPARIAGFVLIALLVVSVHRLSIADWHTTASRRIDIATLGGFPFSGDRGTLAEIPRPLRQLDGQRIELEGFMIPMNQAYEITEFALVPSPYGLDCFGPGPPVPQIIVVHTIRGKALRYNYNYLNVVGTLHVRVADDTRYAMSVYDMMVDSVTQAEVAGKNSPTVTTTNPATGQSPP